MWLLGCEIWAVLWGTNRDQLGREQGSFPSTPWPAKRVSDGHAARGLPRQLCSPSSLLRSRAGSERRLVGSTKVELVRAQMGTASLMGAGGSPVKVGLKRAVLHPQYNPSTLDFDVAMLELARPLAFNKYIQPVCLPLAIQKFPVGRKCIISGWGNMQEGNGEPRCVRRRSTPVGVLHGPSGQSGCSL